MILIRVYTVTLKSRREEKQTKSSKESYSPDQQVTLYCFAELSTLSIPKVGN